MAFAVEPGHYAVVDGVVTVRRSMIDGVGYVIRLRHWRHFSRWQ